MSKLAAKPGLVMCSRRELVPLCRVGRAFWTHGHFRSADALETPWKLSHGIRRVALSPDRVTPSCNEVAAAVSACRDGNGSARDDGDEFKRPFRAAPPAAADLKTPSTFHGIENRVITAGPSRRRPEGSLLRLAKHQPRPQTSCSTALPATEPSNMASRQTARQLRRIRSRWTITERLRKIYQ